MVDVIERHHVRVSGAAGGRAMVFAHGFGCDQTMWRFVAPHFEDDYQVVSVRSRRRGFGPAGRVRSDPSWHPRRLCAGRAVDL